MNEHVLRRPPYDATLVNNMDAISAAAGSPASTASAGRYYY